ncbi:MAG: hypothetical protein ACHP8A_05030 [Terriglobales bacterium]|jgi:hypothetical protein|nr:hypothetical protein [Terriglobales bacterium]
MDIALIMFGSLISTMTALTFLEVRRIRKMMDAKNRAVRPGEAKPAESSEHR